MAVAILLSLLFVAGVALAVLPPGQAPKSKMSTTDIRELAVRFLGAAIVGLLIFVVSGWVLPGLVVSIGALWAIRNYQRRDRTSDAEIARLDALASWIENVRDVLMAGEQPVGAISSTVGACPPIIRPHIRRLAAGLSRQDPDLVFRRFADDLDDPLADLVAAGLAIAIRRGARTVPVLTALAEQTRQAVDRRRLIEAERAPTRREIQALTLIMSTLVILLMVFGRSSYLDSYDTTTGQIVLGTLIGAYALLLVRVQKLAAFPRPGRFLSAGSLGGAAS